METLGRIAAACCHFPSLDAEKVGVSLTVEDPAMLPGAYQVLAM